MFCLAWFLDFFSRLFGNLAHLGFVLRVQVAVILRDVDVDFAAGLEVGDFEFWGFVVTFGAPGDVVGVAEGVDVEDVDVGGGEKEVLEELWGDLGGVDKLGGLQRTYRGEEMPGVEEQKRYDEPHHVRRC